MDDLLEKAWKLYADALRLLNQGDYIDAAEKAWSAVEMIRKAFLISLGYLLKGSISPSLFSRMSLYPNIAVNMLLKS